MATSQNGWTVHPTSDVLVPLRWITGRVLPGDVHTVFDYLCRRFDAEVEPIRQDWSWGWAYRAIRGQTSGYSNHASATAIDLNAPAHPLGADPMRTFGAAKVAAIRSILADLDGVVRWGGNYTGRKDAMHFEINADARRVAAVAARIRGGSLATKPGASAPTTAIPTPTAPSPTPLTPIPEATMFLITCDVQGDPQRGATWYVVPQGNGKPLATTYSNQDSVTGVPHIVFRNPGAWVAFKTKQVAFG
ncbi:M15 family metallopeptidase [Xylanimonas oleitrophica]|uniref:M15 family metallopeptidase n=1 Tax=Xylanimonas oleitrophica TaxID=2607479 RepID=UPI0011B4FF80|nr:M15 family metallopeptidase [Xylanimonas oleitrophica]